MTKIYVQPGAPFEPHEKNAIIFNHIGKAGGTTFRTILTSYLPRANLFQVNNWFDWWRLHKFPITNEIKTALITGHTVWGIQDLLEEDRKIYLTTFLREPWARFRSEYIYKVKTAKFPKPFGEYLREMAPNYLLSCIANGDQALAKHRLLKKYYFFGIVEEYERSLRLFASYFQVGKISYKISNWSLSNQYNEFEKYANEFIEKNSQDIEFYDWARDLLFRRFSKQFTPKKNKATVGKVQCHGRTSSPNNSMIIEPGTNLTSDVNLHRQISEIEKVKLKNHWDCLSLSRLYEKKGQKEKAERWLKNAISIESSLIHELDVFYKRNELQTKRFTAINKIIDLIKDIRSNQVDSQIDLYRNRLAKILSPKKETRLPDCKSTAAFYDKVIRKEVSGPEDPTFYLQDENMQYYSRIAFYGASGCFKIEFRWIKKYIPDQTELFLFDSDPEKTGKELFDIAVHNPESIKTINPKVIFITSVFFHEIYEFLYNYRKKHHLRFNIFNLQDCNILENTN